MRIPHPVPYQGSKRVLAAEIIDWFPVGVNRLIEPFAGSAAISLAAISKQKVESAWINDINAPLMDLWQTIVDDPHALAKQYEQLWFTQLGKEREFYNLVRDRFNKDKQAHFFLYLLARCVKASVRYNSQGEFNQSPDHRRKGRSPQTMKRDILSASLLFRGKVSVTSLDYREVIQDADQNDIVYMDPPYQGVVGKRDPRYIQGIDHQDFVRSLEYLNKREVSYLISYDGTLGAKTYGRPLPRELDLTRIEIDCGRSSQATLLGRKDSTKESLYVSRALMSRQTDAIFVENISQYPLFDFRVDA